MKKRLMLLLGFGLGLTGCEAPYTRRPTPEKERPVVNLPASLRQSNWEGNQREGSCVWASTISLLRWQGHYAQADWIRKNLGNGEWPTDWAAKMDKAGLRYAFVTNGDVKFLEWCVQTRRGAAVTVDGGSHMVNLVHLDAKWACLLDNNSTQKYIWVPRILPG